MGCNIRSVYYHRQESVILMLGNVDTWISEIGLELDMLKILFSLQGERDGLDICTIHRICINLALL